MIQRRHLALVGALTAATLGTTAFAAESSKDDSAALKAEVAALRSEINSLKSSNNWMNDARRDEVKTLVKEVLADADTRASLQGTGATAGYNKGFFLASEDGKFLLQLGGRVQLRYVANVRVDQSAAGAGSAVGSNDVSTGFELRRTQVWFKGHIGSPKISYFIRLDADRNNGSVGLSYAQLDYKWSDNLTLTGGRFKPLFSREENISSGAQMAVERSAVNEAFNVGFSEGIAATYTTNNWRVSGSLNDGARAGEIGGVAAPTGGAGGNYGFLAGTANQGFNGDGVNYAMTGRADYKVFGDWSSWNDFSSWSGEAQSLFIGAGVHFQDSRVNQNAGLGFNADGVAPRNADSLMWTFDAGYKKDGLSLYAAAYGNHVLSGGSPLGGVGNQGNPGAQYSDYGFEVMAGYFLVADVFQPFIRYEYITFDRSRNEDPAAAAFGNTVPGSAVNTVHDVNLITAGYNWYFKKHDAKFSLDVVWAIDSVNAAALGGTAGGTFSGAGLLPDAMFNDGATAENQVAIRAQFQLQF